MQNYVVYHVALVFGVVQAERTAQVIGKLLRCIVVVVVVTGFNVHDEGITATHVDSERALLMIPSVPTEQKFFLTCCR